MPLYSFECENCSRVFRKIIKVGQKVVCECGNEVTPDPASSEDPTVRVVLDKYRKKSVIRNINKIMEKRSKDYQKKYEVGEMIDRVGIKTVAKNSDYLDKYNLKFDKKIKL